MLGSKEGQGNMCFKLNNIDTDRLLNLFVKVSIIFILCISSIFAEAKTASQIEGRAHVIDGDTIIINKHRIRLYGINAPEKSQQCDGGYNGIKPILHLNQLTKNKVVYCSISGKDHYERYLAICYTLTHNLNEEMVSSGHAFAYHYYSNKYAELELTAKKSNIGIWRANCERPHLFRQRNKFQRSP